MASNLTELKLKIDNTMNNDLIELVKELASDMAINDLPYDYRVRRITEYTEDVVKLLATPAVSKSVSLEGRELLLAYTQWLSERDNVDTYWLDDSDVDNFLSQQ